MGNQAHIQQTIRRASNAMDDASRTMAAAKVEIEKLRKALRDLLMERSTYTERAAREALGINLMGGQE
jgi:hypothetical protein